MMKRQLRSNETNTVNPRFLKPRTLTLMLLFLALIMGGVSTVSAVDVDTIYVNGTGGSDSNNGTSWHYAKQSIKNAMETVNTNGNVHIANGTYKGENNTDITVNRSMNIIGQSQSGTIIDAEGLSRIFIINPGVDVTISKLTLANGYHTSYGGAITNEGNLTVSGSTFTGNTAKYGGAISNEDVLTVSDCTFIGNTATWNGGAIENLLTLNVSGSTFTGNTATYDAGAIYNEGNSTLSGSNFTDNHAGDEGGAIYNNKGSITVDDCTFIGNTADYIGGAIYLNKGSVTVGDSNFTGNTARLGGAILNNGGTLDVKDSNFTGNIATTIGGGAIHNTGYNNVNVVGSTFIGNEATGSTGNGGAIYNTSNTSDGAFNVVGSNFTGNTATGSGGAIYNMRAGTFKVQFSRITGNTASKGQDIYFEPQSYVGKGSVNASYNWWGSNSGPSSGLVSENVTVGPWMVLTVKTDGTVPLGGNSTITADLLHDSEGIYHDPNDGHVPDGIDVIFTANSGSINPGSVSLVDGSATSTFTAVSLGNGKVAATIDDQTVLGNVSIEDKTAPTIVSFDPANGTTNLAANKTIKITFSEEIKAGSLWIELKNRAGEAIPFNHTISGKMLMISPISNLSESLYTLLIHTGAVTDMAGNSMAGNSIKFSVGTSPTVVKFDPVNGATNLAANKIIEVTFNEAIKKGSNFWIELVNSSGKAIAFTTSINGKVLTIKPTNNLVESKYKIILHTGAVTDLSGNPLALRSMTFSTGTSPTITSIDPKNNTTNVVAGKTIKVTFNENIKKGNNWIELVNSGGKAIAFTTTINGKVLTIKPKTLAESRYKLILHTGSVTDHVGNPVVLKSAKFSVGTSPNVTKFDPVNGATRVSINKAIKVTFNENIKAGSNYWIELVASNGAKIAAKKSIKGKVLTITPKAKLKANTKYKLIIHTGAVTDTAGNPLALRTTSFTTRKT